MYLLLKDLILCSHELLQSDNETAVPTSIIQAAFQANRIAHTKLHERQGTSACSQQYAHTCVVDL